MADEQTPPGGEHRDEQQEYDPQDIGGEQPDGGSSAPEPEAGGEPAAEPVSEADLDRLFVEQPSGTAPDAVPTGTGAASAGVEAMLGDAAEALRSFAAQARDVLQVGIDSVMGRQATVSAQAAEVAGIDEIAERLGEGPYAALELRLALSETEGHPFAALIPLPQLGALAGLETGTEAMEDGEFRAGQQEALEASARELLDLVSLTLFTGDLSGAEASLAALTFGDARAALDSLLDAGGNEPPLRIDLALELAAGETAEVTLVLPPPLVRRLGEVLAPEAAAAAPQTPSSASAARAEQPRTPEPTPFPGPRAGAGAAANGGAARGFGLTDDPDRLAPGTSNGGPGDDAEVHPVRFPAFGDVEPAARSPRSLDLIMDVQMRVAVELGRSTMTVEDVLSLGPGAVVELNKLAGEPVDVLVNEQLIARGEVVVVDENFGVRITEIVSPRRRAQAMGR